MTDKFIPDKNLFKDSQGRYLTQSLFIENTYSTKYAVYTLADRDKEYGGAIYPSLRRLYLEMMDPTEYEFASTYLWGWDHWQQICANKMLLDEIEKWRDELEVKVRALAVRSILRDSSFSANRWVADGKWKEQKRGRPSKEEIEGERNKRARIVDELGADVTRISDFLRKDNG